MIPVSILHISQGDKYAVAFLLSKAFTKMLCEQKWDLP